MNQTILSRILQNEGGFTADPDDRGNWTTGIIGKGELKGTKYGISAMAFPNLDIKNLDLATAEKIFVEKYFAKIPLVDSEAYQYQLYDHAVNAGVSRALKIYADTVNTPNPAQAAKEARQKYYKTIATGVKSKYLKGWLRRTEF